MSNFWEKYEITDNLCLVSAKTLLLHSNEKLEEETSKVFNLFLNNSEEGDVSNFQGVHLNDIPKVEALFQLNISLYDIDFLDGELIGELWRWRVQKYEKKFQAPTVQQSHLLRQQNQCIVQSLPVYRVTQFSQRWGIWNDISLLVVIVLNIFTQIMFMHWEKRFLKS